MLVEKRFDTGEVVLNYAEGPNNGPPLVFAPGGTQRWQNYILSIITPLTSRWHVYAINHRGHGTSGRTPTKYALINYAKDLTSFIEHLKEPTVLVAHSMGAIISIGTAAQLGDKLKALVLAEPCVTVKSTVDWLTRDWFIAHREHSIELMNGGHTVREMASILGDGLVSPDSLLSALTLSQLDVDVMKSFNDTGAWLDDYVLDDFLKKITCPVLLLRSDNVGIGSSMTDDDVRYALSILPDVTFSFIEGFGHGLDLVSSAGNPLVLKEIMNYLESSL